MHKTVRTTDTEKATNLAQHESLRTAAQTIKLIKM